MTDKRVKHGPFVTEIVRGDPIRVGGREFVPCVRLTSRVRRRAFVGGDGVGGGGWGFVHMRPVAILARSGSDEDCLPVRDEAARWIVWLSLVLLVIPILAVLLAYLSRRTDDKTS